MVADGDVVTVVGVVMAELLLVVLAVEHAGCAGSAGGIDLGCAEVGGVAAL